MSLFKTLLQHQIFKFGLLDPSFLLQLREALNPLGQQLMQLLDFPLLSLQLTLTDFLKLSDSLFPLIHLFLQDLIKLDFLVLHELAHNLNLLFVLVTEFLEFVRTTSLGVRLFLEMDNFVLKAVNYLRV